VEFKHYSTENAGIQWLMDCEHTWQLETCTVLPTCSTTAAAASASEHFTSNVIFS